MLDHCGSSRRICRIVYNRLDNERNLKIGKSNSYYLNIYPTHTQSGRGFFEVTFKFTDVFQCNYIFSQCHLESDMANVKCKNLNYVQLRKCSVLLFDKKLSGQLQEIVERRHREPIKFLFLPKMGLLGSQACNEKKCWL